MTSDPDAPPRRGVARGIESADGSRFLAYVALAASAKASVVVAPDTRGLGPDYESIAERFADAGIHAIVFDWYGRTAGVGPRPADFDAQHHNLRNTGPEQRADLDRAIREIVATGARPLYLVGFSKGARLGFNSSAERDDLAGVIGFFGTPAPRRAHDFVGAPLDRVDRMRAPILGFFGGEDVGIPEATVRRFEDTLRERGLAHHIAWYPRAPHSFFDRRAAEFAEESDDAWRRMLGFIRTGDPAARA